MYSNKCYMVIWSVYKVVQGFASPNTTYIHICAWMWTTIPSLTVIMRISKMETTSSTYKFSQFSNIYTHIYILHF